MDLIGREIFAVGKWNDMTFTEADLDDIVANFESLSKVHKVPLKLGHNEDQTVTDGQPALGWVNRVFREGKKLYADFVDMPKVIYEAVKNKLYRSVSVELLFGVDHKGNRFDHVLDAVALLGADHPAVNTLADLDALLASRASFSGGRRLCFETVAGKRTGDSKRVPDVINVKKGIDMDEKELKVMIAEAIASAVEPLNEKLEVVTKERDDFKRVAENAEKDKAEFEANQIKQKIVAARKTVTELLDASVREKKLTPAMREVYASQIGVDSDDRVLSIDVDQVKLMCAVSVSDASGDTGKVNSKVTVHSDPATELTRLTRVFMSEHGEKNFTRALESVARANPDLHTQYLDSNAED